MIGSIGHRPFLALPLAARACQPRLWARGAATATDAQPSVRLEELVALSSRRIARRTLDPASSRTYLHALLATLTIAALTLRAGGAIQHTVAHTSRVASGAGPRDDT